MTRGELIELILEASRTEMLKKLYPDIGKALATKPQSHEAVANVLMSFNDRAGAVASRELARNPLYRNKVQWKRIDKLMKKFGSA